MITPEYIDQTAFALNELAFERWDWMGEADGMEVKRWLVDELMSRRFYISFDSSTLSEIWRTIRNSVALTEFISDVQMRFQYRWFTDPVVYAAFKEHLSKCVAIKNGDSLDDKFMGRILTPKAVLENIERYPFVILLFIFSEVPKDQLLVPLTTEQVIAENKKALDAAEAQATA